MSEQIQQQLHALASTHKARELARYFQTTPGGYGAGDIFIGVSMPDIRAVAKANATASLEEAIELLQSGIHEERMCALILLIHLYERGDEKMQKRVYRAYIASLRQVNNWDLVDVSAPRIVGHYLYHTKDSGSALVRLASSKNIWYRRVAILATLAFIRQGRWIPTFNIARQLLGDREDLIQKAVGWMLREVGKSCGQDVQEEFLKKYYQRMPRTMLRYAIERLPRRLRQAYLDGKI